MYVAYGISGPSNFVDIIIWIDSQSDMPIRSIQRYLKGLSLRYLLWQEPLQKKPRFMQLFLFHSKNLLVFLSYPPDTICTLKARFARATHFKSSFRRFLISIKSWHERKWIIVAVKNGDKNLIRNPWWKTRVFSDDERGGGGTNERGAWDASKNLHCTAAAVRSSLPSRFCLTALLPHVLRFF